MKHWIADIIGYRDFLRLLIYQHLQSRYHGSVLGFLWTMLMPLLTYLSFTLVFSVLNRWDFKEYGLYFLSGYVFWNFFNVSLSMAAESIVGNPAYVTRVRVPKILLPLAALGISALDLLAGVASLLLFMLAGGAAFTPALLSLPLALALSAVFCAGCGLLCTLANVFFRDFRHLLASVLFLWFFYSPVLWRRDLIPPSAAIVVDLNPVSPFLDLFQSAIWKGQMPSSSSWAAASAWAFGALVVGVAAFRRKENELYYYL